MMKANENRTRYVLVTAAYNEEGYIANAIKAVVAQTHKPLCWLIVSDGSTDCTEEIVRHYGKYYSFIQLHRISEDHPRNFVAQVHAINTGIARLMAYDFDFIGNLDADITLEPTYFAEVLARFEKDPRLGLAGGYISELAKDGIFQFRKTNSPHSIAHAIQFFRRECLEQIGGAYVPMPYGGPDWQAEVNARLHGWKAQAFTDLKVYHHRPTGSAAGLLNTCYREGLMDYSVGSHPCFELFRVARRLSQKPYVVGAAVRLCAFLTAWLRCSERPVSSGFVDFLRKQEVAHLKDVFGSHLSGSYRFISSRRLAMALKRPGRF